MDQVLGLFVQHPERSALIAAVFVVIWLVVWFNGGRGTSLRDLALLIPAVAWGLYAIWEGLLTRQSPEANIRIDLLVIFPILLIATIVGIWLAVRKPR